MGFLIDNVMQNEKNKQTNIIIIYLVFIQTVPVFLAGMSSLP